MGNNKKLRCPLGMPGGVIASLIGLVGAIYSAINLDWVLFALFFGLLLVAMPFMRFIMMVHSANDRLDELERKMSQ